MKQYRKQQERRNEAYDEDTLKTLKKMMLSVEENAHQLSN